MKWHEVKKGCKKPDKNIKVIGYKKDWITNENPSGIALCHIDNSEAWWKNNESICFKDYYAIESYCTPTHWAYIEPPKFNNKIPIS